MGQLAMRKVLLSGKTIYSLLITLCSNVLKELEQSVGDGIRLVCLYFGTYPEGQLKIWFEQSGGDRKPCDVN
jgi:hypothetical protein